jgi:hypothetical protein
LKRARPLVRIALASVAVCLVASTGADAQRDGLASVTGTISVVRSATSASSPA